MRYFIFATILVVGIFFASGISTLKNSAFNQASALGSLTALSANMDEGERFGAEEVSLEPFDRAFDLAEGKSVRFEDLSIRFIEVAKSDDCNESICRISELELSTKNSTEKIALAVGGHVAWGGYRIKISQIAPLENPHGTPSRIVLLVHKESQ